MTDDYARLRAALAAGPTPGPWSDEEPEPKMALVAAFIECSEHHHQADQHRCRLHALLAAALDSRP